MRKSCLLSTYGNQGLSKINVGGQWHDLSTAPIISILMMHLQGQAGRLPGILRL